VLRSNNGEEYTSKNFDAFCMEAGIKRELTVLYNPPWDGVAGRENRSIIKTTKAMIHDLDLSMCFWADACNTTVYILNRCLHEILKEKASKVAFISEKLEVSHFHIFGCLVHIHVPKEKRTKHECLCIKGIFVQYSEPSKAYRSYIPTQRKTMLSKDVKFDWDGWFLRSQEAGCPKI